MSLRTTNRVKLLFSTKDKKTLILKSEAISEKENPINKILITCELRFIIASTAPKVVAANNTGIDIINENFAA